MAAGCAEGRVSARDDVLLAEARALMAEVAADLDRVVKELSKAYRLITGCSDFKTAERAQRDTRLDELQKLEALTEAWWLGHGIKSTLEDLSLDEAADTLRHDLRSDAKDSLKNYIASARAAIEAQAKRRRGARAA